MTEREQIEQALAVVLAVLVAAMKLVLVIVIHAKTVKLGVLLVMHVQQDVTVAVKQNVMLV